ncbi:MAG: chemotaxis protein CheW [Gammaproteobacteria bacterium]|nr:chemotaxis protein CheW [Gammaproteobacteria bacterium]
MSDITHANIAVQDDLGAEELEGNYLKYLSFTVDGEIYALSALDIKEIIEYTNVTRIPTVPRYIRGVTNLRGSVVPVIDLAARIGKPSGEITKRTCIIIVELEYGEDHIDLGVVIDAINEVFNILEDDIEPAPSLGAGIRSDFIWGMGKLSGKFVTLLNKDKVLSVEELAALSETAQFAGYLESKTNVSDSHEAGVDSDLESDR